MNVALATGVPMLDTEITLRITNVNFVGNALTKEAVAAMCGRAQPDVIIVSEILDGVMSNQDLIVKLRTQFPKIRIIYIIKEDIANKKSFLHRYGIFDIIPSKFKASDLEESLFNPLSE